MRRNIPNRKTRLIRVSIGSVIVIGLIVGLLFKINPLAVQSVSVELMNANCTSAPLIKQDLKLVGQNILLIDNVSGSLISKYPCLKDVKVEREFPNRLKVYGSGREVFARVNSYVPDLTIKEASPSSSSALLDWSFPPINSNLTSDRDGIIFSNEQNATLPVVYLPLYNLKIGLHLDTELWKKIALIIDKLAQLNFQINQNVSIKVNKDSFLIAAGKKIVYSQNKDILRQSASLQLILQKAKIDQKEIESVDLRFDKPVVVYKSSKGN